MTAQETNITETITHEVVISFNITEADPLVLVSDIIWTFNGAVIENSSDARYSFSVDRQSLTIKMLNLSDEGIYRMIASNAAGSNVDEVSLNIESQIALELLVPLHIIMLFYL